MQGFMFIKYDENDIVILALADTKEELLKKVYANADDLNPFELAAGRKATWDDLTDFCNKSAYCDRSEYMEYALVDLGGEVVLTDSSGITFKIT